MSRSRRISGLGALGGLVVVDKPGGLTSHDVVGRLRRLAGTRRVGHAGTLDPMATGVLLIGIERATKLLGHLALTDKTYTATVRLGQGSTTDDAEGDVLGGAPAAGLDPAAVDAAVAALTGTITQVPSSFSAIKVDGVRSYTRARAGEEVVLAGREVTVSEFAVLARRPHSELLDLDVTVTCTTGTYVRALARDLGVALGVGGHLTALRRTRVGPFTLDQAHSLEALGVGIEAALLPLGAAVARCFPRVDVDADAAWKVQHGARLPATGLPGLVGVFGPDGEVLALVRDEGDVAKPEVVLQAAGG